MDDTLILFMTLSLCFQVSYSLSVLFFLLFSCRKHLIGKDTKDQGTCNLGNGNGTEAYGKTTDTADQNNRYGKEVGVVV